MKVEHASILIEHFELCCSEAQKDCKQDVFFTCCRKQDVIRMLITCCKQDVIRMFTCCKQDVIRMLFTCCKQDVIHMLFTCCCFFLLHN